MPDSHAPLFDVLDRVVARGLDVRVIFGRPNPESIGLGRTLAGSSADRDMLHKLGSRFSRSPGIEPIDIIFTDLRDA